MNYQLPTKMELKKQDNPMGDTLTNLKVEPAIINKEILSNDVSRLSEYEFHALVIPKEEGQASMADELFVIGQDDANDVSQLFENESNSLVIPKEEEPAAMTQDNQLGDNRINLKEKPDIIEKEILSNDVSQLSENESNSLVLPKEEEPAAMTQDNQLGDTLSNSKEEPTIINMEISSSRVPQISENESHVLVNLNEEEQASIVEEIFVVEQEDSNDAPEIIDKDIQSPAKLKKEELAALAVEVFEKEKEDIIDPRWQPMKTLSSNQERYDQVKSCWRSATAPDPDKNLTFHSYRKRLLKKTKSKPIRQHKRQASTKLSGNDAKRSRPCTFIFDDKINSIYKEREREDRKIRSEMQRKISDIEKEHYRKKMFLETTAPDYGFRNTFRDVLLVNLQQDTYRRVECIKDEYYRKASTCDRKYESGLKSLNNVREEVLQFYSFYKGLGESSDRDPTILSDSQLQELNDIDNFYLEMENYYK